MLKLLSLKVLVKKLLSHDDWKIRRRSERKIPKPINMYTDSGNSLKIENQIMYCTHLMLLTTKLNKTETINIFNDLAWGFETVKTKYLYILV